LANAKIGMIAKPRHEHSAERTSERERRHA
jgi:hypothetical protein